MRGVVEDGLPPALLLLDGMRRVAVEGDADGGAFRAGRELDLGLRSPKAYSIRLCSTIFVWVPAKSKSMLPCLASKRGEKAPPSRRSTVDG
jgi:hypothetical protein